MVRNAYDAVGTLAPLNGQNAARPTQYGIWLPPSSALKPAPIIPAALNAPSASFTPSTMCTAPVLGSRQGSLASDAAACGANCSSAMRTASCSSASTSPPASPIWAQSSRRQHTWRQRGAGGRWTARVAAPMQLRKIGTHLHVLKLLTLQQLFDARNLLQVEHEIAKVGALGGERGHRRRIMDVQCQRASPSAGAESPFQRRCNATFRPYASPHDSNNTAKHSGTYSGARSVCARAPLARGL